MKENEESVTASVCLPGQSTVRSLMYQQGHEMAADALSVWLMKCVSRI